MKKIIIMFMIFLCLNSYVNAIELYSKNYVLYNIQEDEIIIENNKDEKVNIASLTKIFTVMIAIENIPNYEKEVIITSEMLKGLKEANAVVAGFKVNQKVTYNDLFYGALLPSGADATRALAILISGSEEEYAKLMSNRVKELGLENTHFVNSSGLDDEMQYSSVNDVLTFLEYALKNSKFKEIYTTRKYEISDGSFKVESTLEFMNKNLKLDSSYIVGSKTGYTGLAGRCLSSLAHDEKNNIDYILITVGAPSSYESGYHFRDADKVYNYVFENYKYVTFDIETKIINTKYSEIKEVEILPAKTVKKYYGPEYDESKLDIVYDLPEETKPILKDTKIGTATIKYDNEIIETVDLIISEDIPFSFMVFVLEPVVIYTSLSIIVVFTIIILIRKRHK